MDSIIMEARVLAISEIEKYGLPDIIHFSLSESKALELADKLFVNKHIVHLGICLIDLKLGQAFKENRLGDHVQMSVDAAEDFLAPYNLNKDVHDNIINCIAAHHGTVPYTSLEAEICANADCYRFIHPTGFFRYLSILGKRLDNFSDILSAAEQKLDEKYAILSLDICKEELYPYYETLKNYINLQNSILLND